MRLTLFAAILMLLFTACKKDLAYQESINGDDVYSDATAASEYSNCKLRRIVHHYAGDPNSPLVNGLFTYNSAGNPIRLVYGAFQSGTGNPNHYFLYDAANRLTEWRLQYGAFIVGHHFYKYNGANQIVYDSSVNREAGGFDVTVSTIEYDAQNRVVRETIKNVISEGLPLRPTRRPTFTYDNRGNLGVLNWKSSWYDNKVSFLRNHPVFMFITRNYSKNNPWNSTAQGRKYNSKGFPLSLRPANDEFLSGFEFEKLIYDCQ